MAMQGLSALFFLLRQRLRGFCWKIQYR